MTYQLFYLIFYNCELWTLRTTSRPTNTKLARMTNLINKNLFTPFSKVYKVQLDFLQGLSSEQLSFPNQVYRLAD